MEELNFDDLSEIQIPVSVAGKKYVLVEASGDAATKYINAQMRSQRRDKDGNIVSADGLADTSPLLISLCLCLTNADGSIATDKQGRRTHVSVDEVRRWPFRIVDALHNRAKEISNIGVSGSIEAIEKQIEALQAQLAKLREQDDSSKNSHAATTDGSA